MASSVTAARIIDEYRRYTTFNHMIIIRLLHPLAFPNIRQLLDSA